MNIEILPIDYRNMTWKQVFETIQTNISTLYNAILASYTDVEVEQFNGPGSTFTVQSPVGEDTEWLVFKNHDYLGKMEGEGYVVEGQTITFSDPLTQSDQLTILITNGNGIAVLADKYVNEIKRMYDSLQDLDIDITRQIERVTSLKDYLDESAEGILDAKTICAAYKDYIEQLIEGTTPDHGDFADEIVAARRGYPLIGQRMDYFVSTAIEKRTFLDSDKYRDGDWVFVKDSSEVYLYLVKDEYSGDLEYEEMTSGQYAVILLSVEDYTTTRDLKNRVSDLEHLVSLQNQKIAALEDRLIAMERRTLLDIVLNR